MYASVESAKSLADDEARARAIDAAKAARSTPRVAGESRDPSRGRKGGDGLTPS